MERIIDEQVNEKFEKLKKDFYEEEEQKKAALNKKPTGALTSRDKPKPPSTAAPDVKSSTLGNKKAPVKAGGA